jgi:hypothetical protein
MEHQGKMKKDALALSDLNITGKRPSKETLNHPGLIYLASGIDPYKDTPGAYLEAYRSLGIDIINRIPEENAPAPMKPGETRHDRSGLVYSYLGLYDTFAKQRFAFDDAEGFWAAEEICLDYNRLPLPVPHSLDKEVIDRKAAIAGDIGLYYYSLYTTLFMWGVEYLGWEVFMLAAAMDPDGFNEKFLEKAYERSDELIGILCGIDSPFVFCHDDLADARGPVFRPGWYDKYIFPKYKKMWEKVRAAGKKVIFIADGNMKHFLGSLIDCGVYGVMLENPATDLDETLKYFGDKVVIGGIDTKLLTFGTPDDVRKHTLELHEKTKGMPGFVMSSPGGIHGNIPLANLEAYFDARVETGNTPDEWRKI